MIGLGNDYLVNYEFAWTKTLSKNHLGYFSRSSAPAARPNRDITPTHPLSLLLMLRREGVWGLLSSGRDGGLGGHLSGKNRLNEMSDLGNLGD